MAEETFGPDMGTQTMENMSGGNGMGTDSEAALTLLDKIIQEGKMARDDMQRAYARDLVGEFVNQVVEENMTVRSEERRVGEECRSRGSPDH